MKYYHPKLVSAGVITSDVGRVQKRAGAALPPAAMDGLTGPTSAVTNAGSGASAITPSKGSGLFVRIWSNFSIFSRCIVAFLLLDLFVVLNNATCSVRAQAFGASFLLVPDLLM